MNMWPIRTKVITVMTTESVTSTIVKSKYLPISGITNDVGGIISTEIQKIDFLNNSNIKNTLLT